MTGPQAAAHRDRRDDLATYALGALGEAEAAALQAHLASCADSRRYLDELPPAINLLAASVPPLPPPPALPQRLLTTFTAEAERIADASSPAPRRRRRSWRGLAVRPATALAAAFVLLAGAAVGYILHGSSGSGR